MTRPEDHPILAGPIVRRAAPERVWIWLATPGPATVSGVLHRFREPPRAGRAYTRAHLQSNPIARGEAWSIRAGPKLHCHLVELRPVAQGGTIPRGEILAYDLSVQAPPGPARSLADLGALRDLTLPGMPLPTLVLQPEGRALTTLFGSCRKLHGTGPDAVTAYLRNLERTTFDPVARPHALILGGDQVYADDVSDLLIDHLAAFGRELVGGDEPVPGIGRLSKLKLRERAGAVRTHAAFTSDHADNHVIGFGEFAALYLTSWSQRLWPRDLPRGVDLYARLPLRSQFFVRIDTFLESCRIQSEALENSRRTTADLRRTMANVPTYMMFDDHEITDDWNLSERWRERVAASAAGKRVVANGVAAFFLFQGWGNDPERFRGSALISAIEARGRSIEDERAGADLERAALAVTGWHFSAPTRPLTVVMDSRTQRGAAGSRFDYINGRPELRPPYIVGFSLRDGPPRLLNAAAKAAIARLLPAGGDGSDAVVFVATAPVFGSELIESVQAIGARLRGGSAADLESWSANPRGFADMLELIRASRRRRVVILSGDVHYAFAMHGALTSSAGAQRVVQLTSSASKNVSLPDLVARLQGAHAPVRRWWIDRPRPAETVQLTGDSVSSPPIEHTTIVGAAAHDFDSTMTYETHPASRDRVLLERNNVGWLHITDRAVLATFTALSDRGDEQLIGGGAWLR